MKKLLAPLFFLLLSASISSQAAHGHNAPADASSVASPDNLIVPYQRIGAIRLGMGMDEVQSLLGKPRGWETPGYIGAPKAMSNALSWSYPDLNLQVFFNSGVSPVVTGAKTLTWTHKRKTFGNLYGKDLDPVKVTFKTASGIAIGSSSYDVIRAYGNQFSDPGGYGISMNYKSLGLNFNITMDHIVWGIYINQPQ